jgi:hypothetical protein
MAGSRVRTWCGLRAVQSARVGSKCGLDGRASASAPASLPVRLPVWGRRRGIGGRIGRRRNWSKLELVKMDLVKDRTGQRWNRSKIDLVNGGTGQRQN